jgi:hypothetical protein
MTADPTYRVEKSLRKLRIVHSKSSMSFELGIGFREIILYILSIHVHSLCSKAYALVHIQSDSRLRTRFG